MTPALLLLVATSTATGCAPGRPLGPCERALYSELVTQTGRAERAEERLGACLREVTAPVEIPVVEVPGPPTPYPVIDIAAAGAASLGLGLSVGALAVTDDAGRVRVGVAGLAVVAVAVGVWLLAR